MPYVDDKTKIELNIDVMQAKDVGDYNYLFTVAYLKEFLKEPRYKTIALIKKASLIPHFLESVETVDAALSQLGVDSTERTVARDLAFQECYRRVFSQYEDFAIEKNGDLVEFQAAEELIMEKLDSFYRSI